MEVFDGERLSAKFTENGRHYNIYFAALELDGHLTDEEKIEAEADVFNFFMEQTLDVLNETRPAGFNISQYISCIPSGFEALFGEDCIYVSSQRLMTGDLGFTKDEQNEVLDRLASLSNDIIAATAYVDSNFLKDEEHVVLPSGLSRDLDVPSCMQLAPLTAWVKRTEDRICSKRSH